VPFAATQAGAGAEEKGLTSGVDNNPLMVVLMAPTIVK